ncbi:MAG: hypothetical protein IKO40_07365 [Kiritimatiellae bacterium]|nr:hypothetical protein [Kiritimatiellia bacterium]
MTPLAFVFILFSAGLHATWHMLAKKSGASIAFYALIGSVGMLWSQGVHFFTPLRFFDMPSAFHLWLAGMLASELCYAFGLKASYRTLDMSVAYPIMRSLPLLFLAAVTAAFHLGKPLTPQALGGMAMVFMGCLVIPLRSFSDFRLARYFNRSFGYILIVALGTTGYTLCDSQAQHAMRAAADAAEIEIGKPLLSLTYYSFRAAALFATMWIAVACTRSWRGDAAELWHRRSWMPLFAGCCSSMTYVLVLVAMNFVSNVAYVQAFRQIGLVFGLVESVFILKERCTAPKVIGVALILSGLAVSVL